MIQWTPKAEEVFSRYIESIRAEVEEGGADLEEVRGDLRRDIEEELARAGRSDADAETVTSILLRVGSPEKLDAAVLEFVPPPTPPRAASAAPRPLLGGFFIFYAVILPFAVIALELMTRMCAETFFDPMPSWWHTLLVLLVPTANLLVWRRVRGLANIPAGRLDLLSGVSYGIALLYMLVFLPIMPLAVFALIFFGMGILPMIPLFALVGVARGRAALNKRFLEEGVVRSRGVFWWGLALGAALPVLIDISSVITNVALTRAASADPETSRRGVEMLRKWGDIDLLHRACYMRLNRIDNMLNVINDERPVINFEKTRKIYFRVTGETHNARPVKFQALRPRPGRSAWADFAGATDFDVDQGGTNVGGRLRQLHLVNSRLDGIADGVAAIGYYEWTMEFRNDSPRQQEARMQIALPPGGAVSRLTLWVNGEPREAVFASAAKTRQAYQNVVQRRRDPVLVTTSGPDRVLVQCFPVPPAGGMMKIRFGITAPLELLDAAGGRLQLPAMIEDNFDMPAGTGHSIWIESHHALEPLLEGLESEHPSDELYAVRGNLATEALARWDAAIRVTRPTEAPTATVAASDKGFGGTAGAGFVIQRIAERTTTPTRHFALVIDGSISMRDYVSPIAKALRELPRSAEVTVVLATDPPQTLDLAQRGGESDFAALADGIEAFRPAGGCDNLPALERAWDLAARHPDGRILWVHGPQPEQLSSVQSLLQKWDRRPEGPKLYDLPVVPAVNRSLEELAREPWVRQVPRRGEFADDFARVLREWTQAVPRWMIAREESAEAATTGTLMLADLAGGHVVRLHALDQIQKEIGKNNTPDALRMAVRHRLVTPVSGAVVLETEEQYRQAGLDSSGVDLSEIPTIPEPGTWLLIAVAALALTVAMLRRRNHTWKQA